jgi:hypothetical protein
MHRLAILVSLTLSASLGAQSGQAVQSGKPTFQPKPPATGAIKVGPEKGTVIVVGGGSMGPEIYRAFIDAAGGPDALIIDVPNAGGAASYDQSSGRGWRNAGAKEVFVLHTTDRKLADTDSFVAVV